jgi:hypothetical protein
MWTAGAAERWPDREALWFEERRMTFAEQRAEIGRAAKALKRRVSATVTTSASGSAIRPSTGRPTAVRSSTRPSRRRAQINILAKSDRL